MKGEAIRRREFITLLGGAAATWPVAARAQQPAMPVIGFFNSGAAEASASLTAAFRKGLNEAGLVEGRDVAIEYRWDNGDNDRLPELAADLVRRGVKVIATPGLLVTQAAKAATTTIPIVFSLAVDPVQSGLVASLNRPGGNVTGVAGMGNEIAGKRFGLLQELVPGARRFALIATRLNLTIDSSIADMQAAAAARGRQIEAFPASNNREIDTAFESLVQKGAAALLVNPAALFTNRRIQIVTLAARHGVPAIFPNRPFCDVGGLMSYGANNVDQLRLAGIYSGRVLKGEKPSDLPVMQATKFEFVINLQTARTLRIDVPPTLLALADEVIE